MEGQKECGWPGDAPREESPGIHVVGSRGKGGLVNQKANDTSGREGGEGGEGDIGIRDCGHHRQKDASGGFGP